MEYTLGRVGIRVLGAYQAGTDYEALDMVSYNGDSYIARCATKDKLPINTDDWMPAGLKGDTGATGKTAYESAQTGGYIGAETKFNADLAAMNNLAAALAAL